MARFFIDRPIFAWVIAIVITLAGAMAVFSLPVEQYPNIAPPSVSVRATYSGASAETTENSVTQVIEQAMTGIDNLLYMSSSSSSDGSSEIELTFASGTDPDVAQMQVQNKLQEAQSSLPESVQNDGVTVTKSSGDMFMVLAFTSENGSMTESDIADYMVSSVKDSISRVSGVGRVQVMGSKYAMRIWLNPEKLRHYSLMPSDVTSAITAQNADVSSGSLGAVPSVRGQRLDATVSSRSRLKTVDQFRNIILKSDSSGAVVRLSDVATVELGSEDYSAASTFNGQPASGVGIELASGANAISVASAVQAKLDELAPFFPTGLKYHVAYSTTPFVKISIEEVVKTLVEAIALVLIIMYLFLQNWRVTLIPAVAVPVVLMGTFGVLSLLGYSINTLSMFAMVLAIGLLVDDAIVVVENVERVMAEEHLSPKEATVKSMGQIQGALVGIALVLSAVLLPMAFFGGSTGVIYKQFSITIVSAMALSVLVALIFTPALCATMLKPIDPEKHGQPKRGFFGWFNRTFDSGVQKYERGVGSMIKHKVPAFLVYALILLGMIWMFTRIPSAFLPDEDQGVIFAQVQTPVGSSAERTQKVIDDMRAFLLNDKEGEPGEGKAVKSVFTVNGFNFAGRGQSSGLAFVMLKPWDERDATQSVFEVAKRAQGYFFGAFKDAMVFAIVPPSVLELGNATGFDVFLQDQGGVGHDKLMAARNQFLGAAAQSKILAGVRPNGVNDEPQYELSVDDEKASAQGISLADIQQTLAIALGGSYINDFIDRGRVKKVYVQGDAASRMSPEDLDKWYVRSTSGKMVPLSSISSGKWIFGSPKLSRYNGVAAMEILGTPAPGYSTGDAMAEVERIAKDLPAGVGYSWTGLSYEERLSGSQAPALYALSLLVVFLCLAALYESWSIPIAVILVVPLGVIGALIATSLRGLSNDVFFQVGLLVTVGLAAKNAILIVEFAKELHEQGKGIVEAAIEASRMRLRPIIMTSMAFMLGVLPLAVSTGAGSGSQHAIGTGVIGGMITATVLAIFWVPLFFATVSAAGERKKTVTTETPKEAGQ